MRPDNESSDQLSALSNVVSLVVHYEIRIKILHLKELPSRPVGLSFHGLDTLSLSQVKIMGTTTEKNGKKENYKHSSLLSRGHEVSSF